MTKSAAWKHFVVNKKDNTWAVLGQCKLFFENSEQVKRGKY